MIVKIIKFIWLIGVVISDRSLLIEAAEKYSNDDLTVEHRSIDDSPVIQLPHDVVIPLPFVYPEYTDPREQISSTVKPEPSTTEQSLGSAILENVRNTMIHSSSQEPQVKIVDDERTTQTFVRKTNRHRSSPLRGQNNNESFAELEGNTRLNDSESSFEKSLIFGTRLRPFRVSSKKELLRVKNCTHENVDIEGSNDSEEMCKTQSTHTLPRKPHNRTRGETAMRIRPGSANRNSMQRRRRPVLRVEEIEVADSMKPRSLAGKILRSTAQATSGEEIVLKERGTV